MSHRDALIVIVLLLLIDVFALAALLTALYVMLVHAELVAGVVLSGGAFLLGRWSDRTFQRLHLDRDLPRQ
jgi:uncharacterized membrane protein